jgi:hypothetical protein
LVGVSRLATALQPRRVVEALPTVAGLLITPPDSSASIGCVADVRLIEPLGVRLFCAGVEIARIGASQRLFQCIDGLGVEIDTPSIP